jgi:hypothetical protein
MEPKFQTSFIPKKSITTIPVKQNRPSSSVGVLSFLSVIIFLGAVVASVGVFLFQKFTENSINQKIEQLEKAKDAFDVVTIDQLKRLDTRMNAAQEILGAHSAVSAVFQVLQASTLKTVQFASFSFEQMTDGKISVAMTGRAVSYSSMALQADIFGKNRQIHDAIFSNFSLDPSGNVTFNFAAYVDPAMISYESLITTQQ